MDNTLFFFFCKTALFLCWMLCSSDTDKCSRCHVNPLVLGEEWWKLSREMLKIQVLLKESGYIWSLHVSRLNNHVKESRTKEKKTKIDGKRNKFVSSIPLFSVFAVTVKTGFRSLSTESDWEYVPVRSHRVTQELSQDLPVLQTFHPDASTQTYPCLEWILSPLFSPDLITAAS